MAVIWDRATLSILKFNEAPRSPAGRDHRSAMTPFSGISVLLQQAAGYSGKGE